MDIESLREVRKRRGLRQVDVADGAKMQKSLYSLYETGRRPLHDKDARRIGRALKMSSLEARVANATQAYNRAVDENAPDDALKAVRRLLKLAEEADGEGGYEVDWNALSALVDGIGADLEDEEDEEEDEEDEEPEERPRRRSKRPANKSRAPEEDDDLGGPVERDAFGRRVHPEHEYGGDLSRDALGRRTGGDLEDGFEDEDDGPVERDGFGRRV